MNCKTIHHAAVMLANNSIDDIISMVIIEKLHKDYINNFKYLSNFDILKHKNRKSADICNCILCTQAEKLTRVKLRQHRLKKYLYYSIQGEYITKEYREELEKVLINLKEEIDNIKKERKKLKQKLGLLNNETIKSKSKSKSISTRF